MKIRCENITNLAQVCATLVERGIQFDADTHTMVITCTGGF